VDGLSPPQPSSTTRDPAGTRSTNFASHAPTGDSKLAAHSAYRSAIAS
jgi:hypothetical protein